VNKDTLVRLVYESIENLGRRKDFLAKFAETIEAAAVGILTQDRKRRWAMWIETWGMSEEARRAHTSRFLGLNPWPMRYSPAVGQIRRGVDVLPVEKLVKMQFSWGWLAPNGWLDGSSVVIHTTKSEYTSLIALRPPGHTFTPEDLWLYQELAPHLATSTQIEARLAELEETIERYRSGAAGLPRLPRL
jgi:hypothetical protein